MIFTQPTFWRVTQVMIFTFATLAFSHTALSDDDDEWEHRSYNVKGPGSVKYRTECGSCHLAYPPRFLGEASWKRIMSSLEDHFGENAELDTKEQQQILQYLSDNSSRSRWYKIWKKSNSKNIPIRITKTRSFRHEHDEIPRRFVANNPKISSFSQCESCHIGAAKGDFNEHRVHIPGMGRWEDD